jgi:hypothetical protein
VPIVQRLSGGFVSIAPAQQQLAVVVHPPEGISVRTWFMYARALRDSRSWPGTDERIAGWMWNGPCVEPRFVVG